MQCLSRGVARLFKMRGKQGGLTSEQRGADWDSKWQLSIDLCTKCNLGGKRGQSFCQGGSPRGGTQHFGGIYMGHFTRLGYRPIMPTLRNKQHSFALVVIFCQNIFVLYWSTYRKLYMIPNLYTFDNIFMVFFSHKCEKSTKIICNFCDIKRHEFNAILSNLHKIRFLVLHFKMS